MTFDEWYDRHAELKRKYNIKYAVWSMPVYPERKDEEMSEYPNDLEALAEGYYKDLKELYYINHWGPKEVRTVLPENPRWIDLLIAADKLITESGDCHHVFLERISKSGIMWTGS